MAHEWDDERKEYVELIKIANLDELGIGGGGVADEVAWENVTGKPSLFPPAEHNHDERYYTKEQIDAPEFMSDRVDNITVALEGRELKVRSVDGLVIGVTHINEWLAGTDGNIQTQIDGINESIVALTAGMKYLGKLETYADLQSVENKDNGDLAVVLNDESRTGGRSMYVYRDDVGAWDFIGEFTFSDEFIALKDTPSSYDGANGKVVKVAGERLVFGDIDYGDLTNKPASTITQIDDAVAKRHEHSNKPNLDKISEKDGILTYNGHEYVRKSDIVSPVSKKQYLSKGRNGSYIVKVGSALSFNKTFAGNIPNTDTTFTLEGGKVYEIVANCLFTQAQSSVALQLQYASSSAAANEFPDKLWLYSTAHSGNGVIGNSSFSCIIAPQSTTTYKIVVTNVTDGEATHYTGNSSFMIKEI